MRKHPGAQGKGGAIDIGPRLARLKTLWGIRGRGSSLYLVLLSCSFATVGLLLIFLAVTLTPRVSNLLAVNAIDRTKDTVRQSTNSLEVYVSNMLSTLHFISGLLPAEPLDGDAALRAQLELVRRSQQHIRGIAFFTDSGDILCATGGPLAVDAAEVRLTDWFQKASEWAGSVAYFSAPHVQHIFSGQYDWTISLANAFEYERDGRAHTGVLLVDYSFQAIASLASGIQLGASGYAYVIDTQNALVYHPRQHLIYAGLAEEDMAAVEEMIVGVARDEQDGRARILIINTVSQTRWRMVGVAYIDEILALQSAFVRILFIVLLCGGLLSFAGATLTAYYVTRPIRHLQRKMRQVEDGDLNTSITVRGFREIRDLSRTFNHMLHRIRSLMDQIVSEQEAKRLYELSALQAQINPHFLYNTLDSIIWIEEQGRSQEAIEMVSALAKLFRISISKGRGIISVREEIEHVRNYLIIQKMRFRDKFTHEIEVDEAALENRTVKLILQPIVENAVHHAIDHYGDRSLFIRIRVWLDGGLLLMSVSDDGIGIPSDVLSGILKAPPGKSGIGLRNVHERLRLICGAAYGLMIGSVEDEGTTVTIRQPANLKETP